MTLPFWTDEEDDNEGDVSVVQPEIVIAVAHLEDFNNPFKVRTLGYPWPDDVIDAEAN